MITRVMIALFVVLVVVSAAVGNWSELQNPLSRQVLARAAGRVIKVGYVVASALTRAAVDSVCALAEGWATGDPGVPCPGRIYSRS